MYRFNVGEVNETRFSESADECTLEIPPAVQSQVCWTACVRCATDDH